ALDFERVTLLRLAAEKRERGIQRAERLRAQREVLSVGHEAPGAMRCDRLLRGRSGHAEHQGKCDARDPKHHGSRYAALRLDRKSPMRSSALRMFSVEFAYDTRT